MAYCTKEDMIDRFGEEELVQLTDRSGAGVIDDTVLERAISDASAEIDAYLAGRYSLPLAAAPPVLCRMCANMARHALYKDAAPEAVASANDGAVRVLRDIARGAVSLGVAEGAEVRAGGGGAVVESAGRIFGRSDDGFL